VINPGGPSRLVRLELRGGETSTGS
jgi:hypothetical protein